MESCIAGGISYIFYILSQQHKIGHFHDLVYLKARIIGSTGEVVRFNTLGNVAVDSDVILFCIFDEQFF